MFYLVVTSALSEATPPSTDANGNTFDPPQEFKKMKVLFTGDTIASLHGYISMATDDPANPIFDNIFLAVCDDTGLMEEFYMIYEWLPHKKICRVEPPVGAISNFVPTRPKIVNPFCLEAIEKYKKDEEKEAAKEARALAKAEKAANPVKRAAKRKPVSEPAE